MANANVDEAAFPKMIGRQSLERMWEGAHRESTAIPWTARWSKGEEVATVGAVNSEGRRKPKYPSE